MQWMGFRGRLLRLLHDHLHSSWAMYSLYVVDCNYGLHIELHQLGNRLYSRVHVTPVENTLEVSKEGWLYALKCTGLLTCALAA